MADIASCIFEIDEKTERVNLAMNVVLVMFRENGERRSFSLTRDVTVVGRREDADFRIPLSDVSRKHCRLIKDGNALLLEDLGSANGTYHNGQRIQEAEIQPGDSIQVGPVSFVVQINGVPSEEELMGAGSGSQATQVGRTPPAMPAVPPPVPPPVPAGEQAEELEVIEETDDQLEELVEVESDDFAITTDSVAGEDDVIIDLGEAEAEAEHKR